MEPEPASPSTLHTRPTLLFRLRDWRDEASWHEFYRLYFNFVYGCARRSGLSHADAEEVTQDVFKNVAEKVKDFESDPARGSFRGWLLNFTRWRIVDKVRARRPHEKQPPARGAAPDDDHTRTIEKLPDPSGSEMAAWDDEWRLQLLDTAFARLARRVPARQFQVFDLYRRKNWPPLKISRELGVSIASVYLTGHRLTKLLQEEVAGLRARFD